MANCSRTLIKFINKTIHDTDVNHIYRSSDPIDPLFGGLMAGLVVLTWLGTLIMVGIYWRCHGRKRTGHSQLQETNGEGSWRIGRRSFRSS